VSALALASVQAWVKSQDQALRPRAEAAVGRALATRHGEALLASALYRANCGELAGGLADLGAALVRAPMSALVHEAVGRFLVELHAEADGRRHLGVAIGLEPERAQPLAGDLARLDALEGDWASVDRRLAAVAADGDPSLRQVGLIYEARLAGWRGDLAAMVAATARITRTGGDAQAVAAIVDTWRRTGAFDRAVWDALVARLVAPGLPRRVQLGAAQRAIELALIIGQPDAGLALLERAIERGLIDITWLDRCPVFDAVRALGPWQAARGALAAQAERALAAFRAAAAAG
jgi:serine/threonine-protein kinase